MHTLPVEIVPEETQTTSGKYVFNTNALCLSGMFGALGAFSASVL